MLSFIFWWVTEPKRCRWQMQRGGGRESYEQTRLRTKLPQDATITFQGGHQNKKDVLSNILLSFGGSGWMSRAAG